MTDVQHQTHANSFGAVAAEYDRARPSYPPRLFEEIERLAGRPLRGADVLDVGAGTGIATRLLAERGARVIAVEPSGGMAAQLHAVSPEIPVVKGVGDDLPCHDESADLVTYAQAFHWTDPDRSIPEALRVLRPGGALVLFWNLKDRSVDWLAEQERRHAAALPSYHYYGTMNAVTEPLSRHPLEVSGATVRWERTITVDDVITDLRSKSYFAVAEPELRESVLADDRAWLLGLFPDGRVVEPYTVDLTVAVKPR
ncbi:methyltransferase domain-containing protein [Kitasatospora sp. RB6PN24]|uniref:class I SAM-dependent methyltransferase n=1 Tax=Kitasatospora humi TaxID=2893891 RepID=UPI001E3005C2|nr:class I SAM-dependent methyltransferase [Kitasatospora humi]MCC9311218.1 methyltransferase domain-containing protein [Kitasatospora humi]